MVRPLGGLSSVHSIGFNRQSLPLFAPNTLRYPEWTVGALLVEKLVGPVLGRPISTCVDPTSNTTIALLKCTGELLNLDASFIASRLINSLRTRYIYILILCYIYICMSSIEKSCQKHRNKYILTLLLSY